MGRNQSFAVCIRIRIFHEPGTPFEDAIRKAKQLSEKNQEIRNYGDYNPCRLTGEFAKELTGLKETANM